MARQQNGYVLLIGMMLQGILLPAQHYQAVQGSRYAGSLGAGNNPASVIHVPFAWDITPLAIQVKYTTNAFSIRGSSLLSPSSGAEFIPSTGTAKRFFLANQDLRLLNARIRLNTRSAIAFGASVRAYSSVKSSAYNWQDSILSVRGFARLNTENIPLSAEFRAHAWAEVYGTYARTIVERETGILQAGITLKINRGLGGGYFTGRDIRYSSGAVHGQPGYYLEQGNVAYGYSAGFDALDGNGTASEKRKEFLRTTYSTVAFSLGLEYIIPAEIEGDEENSYNYDLKLGLALLDLGGNRFSYSDNSRSATLTKENISDSLVQSVFASVDNAAALSDSLEAIAGSISNLSGKFSILQPARLVVNADKHLAGNFFINGELSLPLTALAGATKLYIQDISLLALTPRYETSNLGLYLPLTLNTRNQVWLGGALKAGPLLLGIHNWANLFSKNKMHRGGAYFAITLRPGKKKQEEHQSGLKQERLPRKQRRQLDCPVL